MLSLISTIQNEKINNQEPWIVPLCVVVTSEDVKIHKSHINSKNQTTIFPPSHSLKLPTPEKYSYGACTMFSHVTGHEKLRARSWERTRKNTLKKLNQNIKSFTIKFSISKPLLKNEFNISLELLQEDQSTSTYINRVKKNLKSDRQNYTFEGLLAT